MKNAEDHNKTLGILHLIYGGIHGLIWLLMMIFFIPLFLGVGRGGDDGAIAFIIFMAVFGLFWLGFTLPSLIAGYGLLKRKSWVKIWAMIAGGLAGMSFPLGMALCAYTFWFWFSGGGKQFYEGPAQPSYGRPQRPGELYGAPQPSGWAEHRREREREYTYVPPSEPPNWRGD